MTQIRSNLSVALAPPLRPFQPKDADTVARLNDMASGGILLTVWKRMAGTNGDPWEQGRHQQFEPKVSGIELPDLRH